MNIIDLMDLKSAIAQMKLDESLYGQVGAIINKIENKQTVKEWRLSSDTARQMLDDYNQWLLDVDLPTRPLGDEITSLYGKPVVYDDSIPLGDVKAVRDDD